MTGPGGPDGRDGPEAREEPDGREDQDDQDDLAETWIALRQEADRAEDAGDLWSALRTLGKCVLVAYDSAGRPGGDTEMYRASLWELHRVALRRGDLWTAHNALSSLLQLNHPDYPGAARDRPHLQAALLRLATTYRCRGNRADAVLAYEQVLVLCREAAAELGTSSTEHDLCDVLDALGHLLEDGGDLAGADDRFRHLLVSRRRLLEGQDTEDGRRHLAHAYDDVGRVAEASGWVEDARTAYADAASLRRG